MENQKTKRLRFYLPMIALMMMTCVIMLLSGCSTTATMARVANTLYANNYSIDAYNTTLSDWQYNIPQAEFAVDSLGVYTWSACGYDVDCIGFTATNPANGNTLYVLDCGTDEIDAVVASLESYYQNANGPSFAYAVNGT